MAVTAGSGTSHAHLRERPGNLRSDTLDMRSRGRDSSHIARRSTHWFNGVVTSCCGWSGVSLVLTVWHLRQSAVLAEPSSGPHMHLLLGLMPAAWISAGSFRTSFACGCVEVAEETKGRGGEY